MKRIVALALFVASLAVAGPLKVASYPVRKFPKAEIKAVKAVAKGTYKAAKALLW